MKSNLLTKVKKQYRIALLLYTALFLSYCSTEQIDLTVYPEVNPLADYLSAAGFDEVCDSVINNSGSFELGFSFKPTVTGRITAIVAKIPDTREDLKVSIWDVTTKSLIRTETIDIDTANVEVTKAIAALILVKDREYIVSFNCEDWYYCHRTDLTNTTYPIISGDITITSSVFISGSTPTFPSNSTFNQFNGQMSFKFQKIS